MSGFLMTLKGLPSTYNKDLQEDKEPMFDAVDTVSASLRITEGVFSTMEVNAERMKKALTMDMLATELAEYLVRKGVSFLSLFLFYMSDHLQMPFRETHHVSGRAVALAESLGVPISEITLEQYKKLCPLFEADVAGVFDFEASVERRAAIGGPSLSMVQRQVDVLRKALAT